MEKKMLMRFDWRKWTACGLIVACVGFALWITQFRATAAAQKEVAENAWKLTPLEVPDTDKPEQLFKFVEELLGDEKEFASADEEREYQFRLTLTLIAVGKRVLALNDATDDVLEKGAQLQLQGHINMAMLGAEQGTEKALKVVHDMEKDSRPVIAQFGKNNEQLVRIICVAGLAPQAREDLVQEVLTEVAERKLAQRALKKAQLLGETLAEADDKEHVVALYGRLAEMMRESGNENLARQADRIEGQVRRMQLPGQFMELEATTLAGDKFDWSAYRGKVVLVDFWATWCGPCRAELPNVKKNYKKYHAQGFEVVGISLDEDQSQLEEFLKDQNIPWVTLFEPEEKDRGWEHPLAVRYGVSAIPQAILVDKEGKVISMAAHGSTLTELLEEHLGKK